MVRTACCKQEGLKKGAWTTEEDQKLIAYINEHGEGGWRTVPEKAGLQRCGKSCRLRWANYLRPDIKRGEFSAEEEEAIIKLHASRGNKWSAIARRLPGRTDNEIKNYWNTHIKKRLIKKGIDPVTHKPIKGKEDPEASEKDSDSSDKTSQDSESDPQPQSSKKSVTASARLLNMVASNLTTFKFNQSVLSGIINGGTTCNGDVKSPTTASETESVTPKLNITSKLLNKMAAKPTMLKAALSSSSVDETGSVGSLDGLRSGAYYKYYSDCPSSASTSTSTFSDDAFDVAMPDSDSTTTFDPFMYCLGDDDFSQCVADNTHVTGATPDYVGGPASDLNSFEFPEFLNLCDGDEFADAENNGFMKELRDILRDGSRHDEKEDDIAAMESDAFEEVENYWNDSLLGSTATGF